MTFGDIKETIKDLCNLRSDEADSRVARSMTQHYKQVTSELGIGDVSRQVSRPVAMTVGVKTVTFTNIEKIDRVLDTTSGVREVVPVSMDRLRTDTPGTGQPETWALQSSTATTMTILTDTVPQTAYTLTADGWASVATPDMNDEPVFVESYHNILVWKVASEEMLRKEKRDLAIDYDTKADDLIKKLRFHYFDSPATVLQMASRSAPVIGSSAGGVSGSMGSTAYTQTALVTYDLGAGVAPFAVAQADAAMVANLDAEKLGGLTSSYYLDPTNLTGIASDRLLGRDTAGVGEVESITVGGGLEFTGSGGIQRDELTGDVTAASGSVITSIATGAVVTAKLADDGVTYAKIQNVTAASRLLGRGNSSAGDPEEISLGSTLAIAGTTLNTVWADQSPNVVYAGPTSGTSQQPAFRSLVTADMPSSVVRVLSQNNTLTTVSNSAAEQTVFSFTVPANTIGTRKLRLVGILDSFANGVGSTVNLRLYFGGTAFHSGTISIAATTQRSLRLDWDIQNISTATQTSLARVTSTTHGGATSWQTANAQTIHAFSTAGAIDTTADRAIAVSVQLDTASSNFSFNARTFTLELV